MIDLDFTSLYPSIIRSLNIGIETLVGRIVNSNKYDNQWSLDELMEMEDDELIVIEKLNPDFTTNKTQVAVKNAASVAGTILTTESVVFEKKEKDEKADPMMGMGGMM